MTDHGVIGHRSAAMSPDIKISYRIGFPDGDLTLDFMFARESFMLDLDDARETAPEWTRLSHHQCPNCPLTPAEASHCPAAVAIALVLATIGDRWSTEPVAASVIRDGRAISIETDLQNVLGAMFGLIGPTSGCPRLAPLRPMARMHAPFVPVEETIARSAALFLLGRYFAQRDGETVDLSLDRLHEMYLDLNTVNIALARRLQSAEEKDAARNAVALLDMRAASADISLDADLEGLRAAFAPITALSQ
ncbi:MAG: hypothetical protein AAF684_11860 [Pseudomonadota bacterium]